MLRKDVVTSPTARPVYEEPHAMLSFLSGELNSPKCIFKKNPRK